MTKDQLDVLRMYGATNKVLDLNNAIWNLNVPFSDAVTAFKSLIDELNDLLSQQMQDVSGIADDKKNRRQTLEELCYLINKLIISYASATANKKLMVQVKFTRSDYTLARDNALVGICRQILDAANANSAALLPYGLTGAMIISLEDVIEEFTDYIVKPRSARSKAAAATKKIPKKIREVRKLLKTRLDAAMELYRQTNAAFYSKYFKARLIVKTPRLKRALKATFISVSTGKAVPRLKVKIDGTINKITSPKGTIYVQHLSEGRHYFEAIMEHGIKTKIDFNIIKGETTKLQMEV